MSTGHGSPYRCLSRIAPGIRYFGVGPSNDHELAIAREVDRLDLQDKLKADAAPEILALLDFRVSGADWEFLKRYILWRMDSRIQK
jgi:hypothetical protein